MAVVSACGRTSLDPAKRGGSPVGVDSAAYASPDAAANNSPDGGADGGWVGPPDIVLRLDGAAGPCELSPALTCNRGPSVATVLFEQEESRPVMGLASSGEEVFVASGFSYDISRQGRISAVSLRTREVRSFDHKGYPANLRYQAQSLVDSPTFYNPSDTGNYQPDIQHWDLRTGNMTTLPQPAGVKSPSVQAVAGNGRGEIFWSLSDDKRTIAKWDPCTNRTELLAQGRDAVFLLADESNVYWQEPKGGRAAAFARHTLLYSMPKKAGGVATLLADVPMTSWNGKVLFAIDEQNLYFLDPASGVLAMPKTGGDRHVVIPAADPLWLDSSTIDDNNIYYVDSVDQNTLRRAPKQGGPVELWWMATGRPIAAVTADACNVYWFATNPPTLYYRAK